MSASQHEQAEALLELINEIRSSFHLLKAVASEVHGGPELTAARRGVLLDLLMHGDLTVPALARRRPVSRQHMQLVVNGLLEEGWAELLPNPAHKRSRLVSLTPVGRRVVKEMVARDKGVLGQLDQPRSPPEIVEAAAVLRDIRLALEPLRNSSPPG